MRIVSLFSGAGGMDLGFKQEGHKIVWANDFDADAVETYRANVGKHIVHGDIRAIGLSGIPEADIVVGGFPCQGFSRANMLRFAEDERNSLYREFLRVIAEKKPRYFIAENVSGILSLDGGLVLKQILSDFEQAGYRVKFRLLNLANYGVPQLRKRVIFLGWHSDVPEDLEPQFPPETHSQHPSDGLKAWVTISEALAGMPEPGDPSRLPNHICSNYKVTFRDFTGHRQTNPQRPSPTILARGNGKGGVCAIPHPTQPRRLSVRESASVQTFPEAFAFSGALNSMYRQVGNAVPVLFARKLAKQFTALEKLDAAKAS